MKRVLPPTYLLLSIAAMACLHLALPGPRPLSGLARLSGLPVLLLAMVLEWDADRVLKRLGTSVLPFDTSTDLATVGVYRITRNPMYLGFVLLLLGIALLLGTTSPFAMPFLFAVLMDRAFVRHEEHQLARTFGSRWGEYRGKVRCWL